jgi:hypothetical protein
MCTNEDKALRNSQSFEKLAKLDIHVAGLTHIISGSEHAGRGQKELSAAGEVNLFGAKPHDFFPNEHGNIKWMLRLMQSELIR